MQLDMEKVGKIQTSINKISENRYIHTVSKSMVYSVPATLAGAVASLLSNIQLEPWQNFLSFSGLGSVLSTLLTFTSNMMALYVVALVAYILATSFKVDGRIPSIMGVTAFLMLTPLTSFDATGSGSTANYIAFDWLGAKGVFSAILIGIFVGRLYALFINKKIYIRMPDSVPAFVEKSFAALIPFICIMFFVAVINQIFSLTSAGSVHQFIYSTIQVPLTGIGASLPGLCVAYLLLNLCWFLGIHGKALVFAVIGPILVANNTANMAIAATEGVGTAILDMGFTTVFFEIGGSGGCPIGLALVMLIFAKSERYRAMGKIFAVPTICGINEPITYGTPMCLNFHFLIPMIVVPLITGCLAYAATIIGFMPYSTGAMVPTGCPILVSALLLFGWQGVVVQLICILISCALYFPFFKMADAAVLKEEQEAAQLAASEAAQGASMDD